MTRSLFVRVVAAVAVILTLTTLPGLAQQGGTPPDLLALAEAERAFARTSVEKGVRASFLEFFTADCITFAPDPGNARARLLSRPAPATVPPVVLNWRPIYADISQAGDMGYTTGPSTFIDHGPQPRPPYYGYYFSVWKKQTDGSWKVVLDIGTETPDASAVPQPEFSPAPTIRLNLKSNYNPADGRAEVIKLENEFSQLASTKGSKAAYLKYRAADLRLHRDGHFPMVGAGVENSYLWKTPIFGDSRPFYAEVAKSGDLAYVYGSYELKNSAGATTEKGFYARVWRRDTRGKWNMAADITNLQPAGK